MATPFSKSRTERTEKDRSPRSLSSQPIAARKLLAMENKLLDIALKPPKFHRSMCARKTVTRPAAKRKRPKNTEERGAGVPPAEGVSPKEAYEAFRPHLAGADADLLKRIAADIPERVSPMDAYKAFRPHLDAHPADDELLKLIEDDVADARAGRALKPLDSSDEDDDDDDLERVTLEINIRDQHQHYCGMKHCEFNGPCYDEDSKNVQYLREPSNEYDKNAINVLVDGEQIANLPRVYAKVLARLMDKGYATLEHKSFGCPGYIHVDVVATTLKPVLSRSVHGLENAWED